MTNFILLVASAVVWGFQEQHIYRNGYRDTTYHLFGKVSLRYHLPMVTIWGILCTVSGYWWMLPAYMVIEDWSYFRFHPTDSLDPKDWVNFGLGGFRLFGGAWIPTVYLIGFALSAAAYHFIVRQ
jgi:hypothetical protein